MSVRLDKTAMVRDVANRKIDIAPGRQLYVLETNGPLDRYLDPGWTLGDETQVQGYSDEALTTPISQPFAANASGQYDVWFGLGSYDLYAPADITDKITRWQPIAGAVPAEVAALSSDLTALTTRTSALESDRAKKANLPFVSLLAYTGTFDAMLTSAKAAVGANGGTIAIPAGAYTSAAPPSFQNTRSVTLKGAGGSSAGAACATQITYTGTATRPIDARATNGFRMQDIQFLYSNASFAGTIVDFVGSAYGSIERCYIGGTLGILGAASLMELDQTQVMSFRDTVFAGAARAANGMASGSWANAVTFDNCIFKDLTSTAVRETGEAWSFRGCVFQNLVTSGGVLAGAGAITCTVAGVSTLSPKGTTVTGCWFGDATAVGTWILVKGTGWHIAGNSFGGGSIGIDTRSTNTQGVTIVGNRFDVIANAIAIGAQKNLVILGNDWSNCTLGVVYAAIPPGSIVQDNAIGAAGHIQMYGNLFPVAGAVSDGNFAATPPDNTMALDTTNSRLYVRVGGTWKYAQLT